MIETTWHPSQTVEIQDDGSVIIALKVRNDINFRSWVLRWGNDVEVLKPETLRNQISEIAQSLVGMYTVNRQSKWDT